MKRQLPKEGLCRLLNYDPLSVYPGDQLLEGLEWEGAVPDELRREVDAVPPPDT